MFESKRNVSYNDFTLLPFLHCSALPPCQAYGKNAKIFTHIILTYPDSSLYKYCDKNSKLLHYLPANFSGGKIRKSVSCQCGKIQEKLAITAAVWYNEYEVKCDMKRYTKVTKADIVRALREIGVSSGMNLEVHSSLSSFGMVEEGAHTVIDALKECVGAQGSIFMPSLRLSPALPLSERDRQLGITSKIKILPENRISSAMGIIADTFRMQKDTVTGGGVMQISGWGLHAGEAAVGGLDFVLNNGGKALLLGVDIYKLTAMHYVESLIPEEIGSIFAPNEEINAIYPPERWFIEAGEPPVKAWYTIQSMAYERGFITDGKIGDCKVMFFDLRDVVGLYESELKRAPYALFGVEDKSTLRRE